MLLHVRTRIRALRCLNSQCLTYLYLLYIVLVSVSIVVVELVVGRVFVCFSDCIPIVLHVLFKERNELLSN